MSEKTFEMSAMDDMVKIEKDTKITISGRAVIYLKLACIWSHEFLQSHDADFVASRTPHKYSQESAAAMSFMELIRNNIE